MTDEEAKDTGFSSLEEALGFVSTNTAELLDLQHLIMQTCIQKANDWYSVASAFDLQRQRALDNAAAAAYIARETATQTGDMISAHFGLTDEEESGEEQVDECTE